MSDLAPGQAREATLRAAGFGDSEVAAWRERTRGALSQGGFTPLEQDNYFGVREPDLSPWTKLVHGDLAGFFNTELPNAPANESVTVDLAHPTQSKVGADVGGTAIQGVQAGFERSVTGLAVRGRLPETAVPDGTTGRLASEAGQLAGDFPAMAAGAALGGLGGGAAGAEAGPADALIAAGTAYGGAFALPEGLRTVMMDSYTNGSVKSAGDFAQRVGDAFWASLKGYTTGALTGVAGKGVELAFPFLKPLAQFAAKSGAEIGTMVTVPDFLQGKLPEPSEFLDAAVAVFGLHMAGVGAARLRTIYAKTGVRPATVAADAASDPGLRHDLASSDVIVPDRYTRPASAPDQGIPVVTQGDSGTPVSFEPPPSTIRQDPRNPKNIWDLDSPYPTQPQPVEGAAGLSLPQAGDATETPTTVSVKPRAEKPVRRPSDLVKWLARKGGLRGDDPEHRGDLHGMGAHDQFVPGAGMLVRKSGGMALDRARELATEAGYGPFETTSDLLNGIDNALRGGDEFSQNDMDQVVRWKEQDTARRAGPAPDAEQSATDQIKELRNRADALGVEHDDTWTAEDLLAGVVEREAVQEDSAGAQAHLDAAELDLDRYIAKQYPHLTGELARNGYDSDIPFGPEHGMPARPTEGGGQHEVAPGGSAGDGNAGTGAGDNHGGAAEGRQLVLPGGERSARQLAAGRESAGRGRVAAAVDQRAADEGLFAAPTSDEPSLFMQRGPGGDAPIRAVRDLPIKRGAAAIIDRLRMQANLEKARIKRTGSGTPLDAADIREVEDFISFVGEKMFDDVGLRIRADQGPQGQYETANRIVTIFRRAIEYGQLTRTAIHELWHSLDRVLSPKDRQAVYDEFQRAQYDWLLKNPWAEPFLDGRGDLRNHLTGPEADAWRKQFGEEKTPVVDSKEDGLRFPWEEENYRFTNVDEYFAETMTDKYRDFADMKDARARSIFAHVRDIWDHMVASFKRLFGGDATGRIFEGFGKGAYEPPAGPRQPGAVYFSDYTPAEQAVLDRIVSKPEIKRPFSLEQLYTDVIDDLNPVKVMERTLAGEKPLETKDSPYALMRLFRGTPGRVEQFLERSPFKFGDLSNIGKSLKDILRPVRNDLDGLRAYIASRRSIELGDRDIVTGIPRAAAEQVVADGDARYAEITQELHDYQRHLLDYLRDSGVLGDEAYRKIVAANEDYVPFYRLMGEDEGRGGPSAKGKVKNPIKTIKGSERQIIDPLESIVRNTDLYIKLAEKNRALTSLVALAGEHDLGEDFLKKVPTQTAPIQITDAEAARFLKDQGINAENAEGFTVFRPRPFQPSRDEIAIFRDGKREVYRVIPELADAVNKMDPESLPWYIKMLALPSRALRAGATLIPDFIARNVFRDQITANSLSSYGFVPFYDTLRGLGATLKKDADYQAWLKSGGANGAMVSLDRNYMEKEIFGLAKQTGMLDRVMNVIKTPFEMLRIASEIGENATRLGAFKRAMSATGDPYKAAFEAREVTLDFARIGAKMRAVNAIVAFSNAGIQGVDRVVRAFKENPLGTTAKTIAAITVPSVLLWFANHDDPRWKGISQWERDLFWIVMTKDHIYRIPKPFELGIVFGTLPEHALDAFYDKKPDAFEGVTGTVLNGLMPNYIPTFALPAMEAFANRSTFTGNKLVPVSMEGILPEYQYTNYTTDTAKILGRFIAIMPGMKQSQFASPIVLENYLRAWSGGLGMYALQTSDLALRKAGVINPPPAPESTLADTPFVKAFVVRYPSASDQRIQDFYDRYTQLQQALDTITGLARRGEPDAAMRELRVQRASDTLVRLGGLQKGLANIEKEIRLITIMPDMPPPQKRQMIDGLYYSMIQGADMGNKMLDRIDALREGRPVAPTQAGQ